MCKNYCNKRFYGEQKFYFIFYRSKAKLAELHRDAERILLLNVAFSVVEKEIFFKSC